MSEGFSKTPFGPNAPWWASLLSRFGIMTVLMAVLYGVYLLAREMIFGLGEQMDTLIEKLEAIRLAIEGLK